MTDTREQVERLVQRLKVVARSGTDSTMRHSAYAFMAQDPDGDYVTYSAYAAQAEENRRLREALQPFADVAEHDIGSDEADCDAFRPMFGVNRAPYLTVGDLRRARAALSSTGEKG